MHYISPIGKHKTLTSLSQIKVFRNTVSKGPNDRIIIVFNHVISSTRQSSLNVIKTEILIGGYASGYFPMAESKNGEIKWFSPDPRGIIPLDTFTVSRSLHQTVKKKKFDIRCDTVFEAVMRHCAERDDTWISEEIIQSYVRLYQRGYAHSVEAWKDDELVGGLYGVAIGAAFFGESMFSRTTDASKVALVYLVERLRKKKFDLLDTQFITPHLARFGAVEIPREEYLMLLKKSIYKRRSFTD